MMNCCFTAAEGARHKPPGVCPNHNGEKHTENKTHRSIFYFQYHLYFTEMTFASTQRWYLLFSPSENPSVLSGAFAKWAKAQENAFCCWKGKRSFPSCLSLKPIGADWLWPPPSLIVDQPQPFSSRQRSGHTSYDEAPPALALWASERSAQIYRWSQEKPL